MAVDTKAPERIGCGDHSCVIAPPRGMGTNGGCRCDARKLRREVLRLQKRYEEAMEVLRPFAAFVDVLSPADADDEIWTDGSFGDATEEVYRAVTVEDFRRAQAIMLRHKEGV